MFVKLFLLTKLLVSWASIMFIPKNRVKRFMPSAFLASLLVIIVYEIAYYFGWWKIKKKIVPWVKPMDVSFVFGPFIVGTVWVFHLTYKLGYLPYMIMNLILDGFFAYAFMPLIEKMGVVKLKKISRTGIYYLMLLIAVIIYPYQKWQDGVVKVENE